MQFESIWSMVFNPSYTSSSLNLPLCKYYNKVFESTLSHRGYFSILKAGWVFKSSILCPNTTFGRGIPGGRLIQTPLLPRGYAMTRI